MNNPICTFMVGAPGSGKNTYIAKHLNSTISLSCDDIREANFGKNYKHSRKDEDFVWERFYWMVKDLGKNNKDMIINNTNTKMSYINQIKKLLPDNYEYRYIFLDVPKWKLYIRNILRWMKTGKYIPIFVINRMVDNLKILKKNWKNDTI